MTQEYTSTSTHTEPVVYSHQEPNTMTPQDIAAFATIAVGVVASYAQNRADMARLKERVYQLEKTEESNAKRLERIETSITRVEMALVKAGLIPQP